MYLDDKIKDYKKATGYLKKARDIDKEDKEVLYYLGYSEYLQGKGHYDGAIEYFDKAVDYNEPLVRSYIAWCKYYKQEYSIAIGDFDKVLKDNNQDYKFAHQGRALCYYDMAPNEIIFFRVNAYQNALKDFEQLDDDKKELYKDKMQRCEREIEKSRYIKLLLALFAIMPLNYIFGLISDKRDPNINLTFSSAVNKLSSEVFVLLAISIAYFLDDWLENEQNTAIPVLEIFIILSLMYEFSYLLNNADRAGIPVPAWLLTIVKEIIRFIEKIISVLLGRGNNP